MKTKRNNNNYRGKFFALYKDDEVLVGTFESVKEIASYLEITATSVYEKFYRSRKYNEVVCLSNKRDNRYYVYIYEDTDNDALDDLQNIDY